MRFSLKRILATLLLPAALLTCAACSSGDTPYDTNDEKGYTVSVKFDANGGLFGPNTSVIADSFDISKLNKNSDGMVEIPIISPDNETRGRENTFKAGRSGYYLAGWYAERTENTDADGNVYYTYSNEWNFDTENFGSSAYAPDVLKVDPGKTYSSAEPVLTLYAAWVPEFKVEFYDVGGDAPLYTYTFDPIGGTDIKLPYWEEQGVTINMGIFPSKPGYSYKAAYTDKEGNNAITGDSFSHSAAIDEEKVTVTGNPVMAVYLDWTEGEEYRIYNAEQFTENYKANGNYTLYDDLDFTDEIWPSALASGIFNGTINGNGHSISNVKIDYTANEKTSFGLFGRLDSNAVIKDLTFKNAEMTISKGARMAGTCYGLFAGTVSEGTKAEGVAFENSKLLIAPDVYFLTDDYVIDLVCGSGTVDMDYSGISCEVAGGTSDALEISLNGTAVNLIFAEQ